MIRPCEGIKSNGNPCVVLPRSRSVNSQVMYRSFTEIVDDGHRVNQKAPLGHIVLRWAKKKTSLVLQTYCAGDNDLCKKLQFRPLNLFPSNKPYTLPNWKSLQRTILNLMQMASIVLHKGRKHRGKRRNCSWRAIFLFLRCFQKTCTVDTLTRDFIKTNILNKFHDNRTEYITYGAYTMFF